MRRAGPHDAAPARARRTRQLAGGCETLVLMRRGALGAHAARLPTWHDRCHAGLGMAPHGIMDATAGDLDLDGLRASARRLGAPPREGLGWFGELLRERAARSLAERTALDWESLYPGLDADERAVRHIARAARRAALVGGLTAASTHVGEAVTILTEGLAAPIYLPAFAASVVSQIIASAKVQIDLVFDLGSIYGVPSDVSDPTELGEIFDLALDAGKAEGAWCRGDAPHAMTEGEILARLGRRIVENAMLGLVPLVGIPVSAVSSYRATARVGEVARRFIRRRAAGGAGGRSGATAGGSG